jgi:hypothetical protein
MIMIPIMVFVVAVAVAVVFRTMAPMVLIILNAASHAAERESGQQAPETDFQVGFHNKKRTRDKPIKKVGSLPRLTYPWAEHPGCCSSGTWVMVFVASGIAALKNCNHKRQNKSVSYERKVTTSNPIISRDGNHSDLWSRLRILPQKHNRIQREPGAGGL